MNELLFGHDETLAKWAADHIPWMKEHGEKFGACAAIGVVSEISERGRLQAVAVYHDYIKPAGTIQVSIAARTPVWAKRGTIRALLSYPFEQLRCNLVWCAMRHTDARVIAFNRKLGFKQDGVLRDRYGPGTHAVITSMRYREYKAKWVDGQVVTVAATGS